MAERIALNVKPREATGKGAARSLRRQGEIPAVSYRGGESTALSVNQREMVKFIMTTAGGQGMVDLRFPDDSTRPALMKEYQSDPVKGDVLHADFFEVSMTEEVRVSVHLSLVGEAIGVKRDKGILEHVLREVEVECLPDRIPGQLEIDVAKLGVGQSIHVGDITAPDGVAIITDPGEVIVMVAAPAVLVEEAEAPAEEVAVEAPEVVKKGKKEEAEEEEGK